MKIDFDGEPFLTQQQNDVNILGLAAFLGVDAQIDVELEVEPTAQIQYDIDVELKPYGIRSMDMNILKVTTSIEWSVNNEDLQPHHREALIKAGGVFNADNSGGRFSGVIEIDTTTKPWNIQIMGNLDNRTEINEVQIDLVNNIIELS